MKGDQHSSATYTVTVDQHHKPASMSVVILMIMALDYLSTHTGTVEVIPFLVNGT